MKRKNRITWFAKVRKAMRRKSYITIRRKTKVIAVMVAVVLVCAAVGGGIVSTMAKNENQSSTSAAASIEGTVQKGNLELTASASGTTTGTTAYQLYDLELSSGELEVETVSCAAGDTVKKGDTLLTLTKESVEEVKEALEEAVTEYQLELSLAQITYEEAVNEAEEEYETDLSLVSTASLDYQDTLEAYEKAVETQKKQLEQAQEVIKEYPDIISSYQDKKAKEMKNKKVLQKQMDSLEKQVQSAEQKLEAAEKTYDTAKKDYSDMETVSKYLTNYSADSDGTAVISLKNTVETQMAEKKNVLQKAEDTYQKAKKSYDSQKTKLSKLTEQKTESENKIAGYAEKISSYQAELKEAKTNLTSYQSRYYSAVSEQAVGKVSAGRAYAESMQQYQSASSNYQAALKEAKGVLQTAKDNYNNAKKKKNAFASFINGQRVCASQDGTISNMSYTAGDILTNAMPIAGYQDDSVINIEVSFDQADIPYIEVGEEVNVSLSSVRGQLTGTVSAIETESSSESMSSVSYTVIVTLDNAEGMIGMNETAAVSFQKGSIEDVIYVPVSAVIEKEGKSVVNVKQEDNTTKQVTVSVGEDNGQYVVIENGLEEGDTYVVEMES